MLFSILSYNYDCDYYFHLIFWTSRQDLLENKDWMFYLQGVLTQGFLRGRDLWVWMLTVPSWHCNWCHASLIPGLHGTRNEGTQLSLVVSKLKVLVFCHLDYEAFTKEPFPDFLIIIIPNAFMVEIQPLLNA
jgi:hypothetical protein